MTPPAVKPVRRCHCGAVGGIRHYVTGYRCPLHTPAALAGQPEPDAPRPVQATAAPSDPPDPTSHPWPAHETGPCARCRRSCHRYGDGGRPLCGSCPTATAATP